VRGACTSGDGVSEETLPEDDEGLFEMLQALRRDMQMSDERIYFIEKCLLC
jgi:hypothetical protein